MAQTLLTEVQEFCERKMLPVPSVVIGSNDPNVKQIKAILYEAGQSLAVRGEWSRLTHHKTIVTIADENQGNIFTLTAGIPEATAFRTIKQGTFWDMGNRLPVLSLDHEEWRRMKAAVGLAPRYRYRLFQHNLLLSPAPPAGVQMSFEWVSKWWIQDEVGTVRERFGRDSDSFLLERELLKLSLRWRWNKEKGLPYKEEENEYESRVKQMLGNDVPREVLMMDGEGRQMKPGVFVPESSWGLSQS